MVLSGITHNFTSHFIITHRGRQVTGTSFSNVLNTETTFPKPTPNHSNIVKRKEHHIPAVYPAAK